MENFAIETFLAISCADLAYTNERKKHSIVDSKSTKITAAIFII